MCHISAKPDMVGRDGTCIDAASPSHAMTMGPMKAIPMWYELSVTHLVPAMPNLELRESISVLQNVPHFSKTRYGWQGWHMY